MNASAFSGGLLHETISDTLQTLEDVDLFFLGLNPHFHFMIMWDY